MSDFFVTEEELKEDAIEQMVDSQPSSPAGYVPLWLSSRGKLNTPELIHVRDYNGRDQADLTLVTSENELNVVLDIVRRRVYEDIDVEMLHEKELEEILATVHNNFWSNTLEDVYYPVAKSEFESLSEEEKEAYTSGKQRYQVDIPISDLEVIDLADEFKEPFSIISSNNTRFTFRLERVKDVLRASKYIQRKYAKETRNFMDIERQARKIKSLNQDGVDQLTEIFGQERVEEYMHYSQKKLADFFIVKRAQCILKKDGKELTTIDEQMAAYDEVPISTWSEYGSISDKYAFGISNTVSVISPITGKKVSRRFSFRFQDFFPKIQPTGVSENTVIFGE